MTADDLARIRALGQGLCTLLGVSIGTGSLTLHYADQQVQRVETQVIHQPTKRTTTIEKR